jgi:hypothetical protein
VTARALLVVVMLASPADAGRTQFGWLPETETLADGAFELGTSLYEYDNLGPYHVRSTSLLWTPAIGLTHCLELAFPVELVTRTEDDAAPWSGVSRYGAELRWRFLRNWPELHPVARFAVSRDVEIQSAVRTEAGVAAAYDAGPVQIEGAVGGVLDINFAHFHRELRPGLGANVRVNDQLRLGAELYAQLSRDDTTPSWAVVGPDAAWQRGRFWLSAALGVGIKNITAAPRLNLGAVW